MTTIALYLPFPPSTNHYYRNVYIRGHCRTLISSKGREYRKRIQQLVQNRQKMEGELSVSLQLVPPSKHKRDIDNYNKALLDSLTHSGLWDDDSQIKRLAIEMKAPNKDNPHAAVVVSTLGDENE